MKTFNKKDVFCIANAEQAEQYIGHECYFDDSYTGLQYSIDNNIKGVLKHVGDPDTSNTFCVFTTTDVIKVRDSRCITSFSLCLPCELVKEEEPKYRPFTTIDEFISVVGEIGSVICFKPENCNAKYSVVFSGILETEFGKTNVLIGAMVHDFAELFEEYVLVKDGKEVPFGIKVKSIKVEHEQD